MHSLDTNNSASRPNSCLSNLRSRGASSDENAGNHVKRKPSVPRLSLHSSSARPNPTRPTANARITATAHTASSSSKSRAGSTNKPLPSPRPPSRRRTLPLQPKDGNAAPPPLAVVPSRSPVLSTAQRAMRLTASSSSSSSAKMPPSNSSRQPQMPTLAKPAPRAPLTPKVVGARTTPSTVSTTSSTAASLVTPQNQQQQQQQLPQHRPPAGLATPVPRRPTRSESLVGNADTPKDDYASPVSALLQHSNITPRSGSRQTRVDSANSTPTGTPQPESSEAWDYRPGHAPGSSHPADGDRMRRPIVAFSVAGSDAGRTSNAAADSKFFYASSAKPPAPQAGAAPKLFQAPQKTSTFCYANGAALPPTSNSPTPGVQAPYGAGLGPPMTAPNDTFSSKFVYANGAPDALPSPRSIFSGPSRPGSSMSTTSKVATGRVAATTATPAAGYGMQRPVSPLKQSLYPAPKSGPGSSVGTPGVPTNRITPPAALPYALPAGQVQHRRTSNEYPHKASGGGSSSGGGGHSRNKSVPIVDGSAFARVLSSHPQSPEVSSPTGLGFPAAGFAGILQAAAELSEGSEDEEAEAEDGDSESGRRSPSKPNDPLDELVTNARRERKVQDLQITNASLEAINRTLERQLRKQNAELRRYRRLSRSGRLSLASVNSGVGSDLTVEGPLRDSALMGLEDLSEEDGSRRDDEEEEAEDFEDESDSESGSGSGGSSQLSPNTMAARDARHRKRDEKRLLMDLSKHQQLLVDSQKINQSIKRCLGWTEELIKEGRRALEYQVRVSEVEIGGHVLRDADEDDHDDDEAGETMPAVVVDFGHGDDSIVSFGSGKGPQDRDSGVELPADGG